MTNIYMRIPQVRYCSLEETIEQAKGNLRFLLNTLQENNLQVVGSKKIKRRVFILIKSSTVFNLLDSEDLELTIHGRTYLKIMSFSELEDMFRQEAEYWVIRNKLPVYTSIFYGGPICIFLTKNKKQISFPDFRAAEKYIDERFKSVERIRIAESTFAEEDNLVALYKIK